MKMSDSAREKLERAGRVAEQRMEGSPVTQGPRLNATPLMSVVITGPGDGAGRYTGKLRIRVDATTWEDGGLEVYVRSQNGTGLIKDMTYPCRPSHQEPNALDAANPFDVYLAYPPEQMFATAAGAADGSGRTKGTLTSVLGARPSDGQVIRMHPINAGKFTPGRVYPVWPTATQCKAGVGPETCPAATEGAPTTYSITTSTLPAAFSTIAGTFTLTHSGACNWSGGGWVLNRTAGTLVGTAGANTVTYNIPGGSDPLAATTALTYASNTAGQPGSAFGATIPLTGGPACSGSITDVANTAPVRQVFLADPSVGDYCPDLYSGSYLVVTNVTVVCSGGVITTTQTKVTVTVSCGKTVSVV